MDLFEAIARRYSYRGAFSDAPVLRKDLEKIVQAGIHAPSACNAQVATFVIVDDPKSCGRSPRSWIAPSAIRRRR